MTTTTVPAPHTIEGHDPNRNRFRPDLEGLRGVAVALVVLFHAGLTWLPGGYVGVDVFYVLSGFFITGLLVNEITRTTRVSFRDFYARRGRRLVPTATLVLVATAVASFFILPRLSLHDVGWDTITSAFDVANIHYAAQATDYLAADQAPSPLLHFWSLALEEQFYLVWPLLLFIVTRGTNGNRATVVRRITVTSSIVVAASLAASIILTPINTSFAFFMLPTRAWELGIGALLAVGAAALVRIATQWRWIFAITGIAGLIYTSLTFNADTVFPGYMALLPVLSTAALIAAGPLTIIGSFLATRPMRALGRWSYSLYLWHWPILVLAAAFVGAELSIWVNLGLMVAATALAAATYRIYEKPLHLAKSSAAKSLALALSMMIISGAAGAALVAIPVDSGKSGTVVTKDEQAIKDAIAAGAKVRPVPENLTPALSVARNDMPQVYADGCHNDFATTELKDCVYGDPAGTSNVWLVGDSHAAQWFPAINTIAKQQHWKLTVHTKSGCPDTTSVLPSPINKGSDYTECVTFQDNVLAAMKADKPDFIITASTLGLVGDDLAGFTDKVTQFTEITPNVVVIGENPHQVGDVPPCVSEHLNNAAACNADIEIGTWHGKTTEQKKAVTAAGIAYIDTVKWLCTDTICPVIADNVLLYRDTAHLTPEATQWLTPLLKPALLQVYSAK